MNRKTTYILLIIIFIIWTCLAVLIHNTNIQVTEKKENCNDSVLVYADYNPETKEVTYINSDISICNIEE